MTEEFSRCYWLIKERLLAGPYPYNQGAEEPESFLDMLIGIGVNSFVDLTEEDEYPHYFHLIKEKLPVASSYARFPIKDYSVPELGQMKKIVRHLREELDGGKIIYLHCMGGIGRTGTVAGCYLVETGLNGKEAISKLAELFRQSSNSSWARSPETDEQREFVVNWNQK